MGKLRVQVNPILLFSSGVRKIKLETDKNQGTEEDTRCRRDSAP